MEDIVGVFMNPWVGIPVLLIPVVVILLAKSLKKVKDKKAAAAAGTPDA